MKCTSGKVTAKSWDDGNGTAAHAEILTETSETIEYRVDLNDCKSQGRILSFITNPPPPGDKKGHHVTMQCKIHPTYEDVAETLRAQAPKGYWKSISAFNRSSFCIGMYVIAKYLKDKQSISELETIFSFFDTLNVIAKHHRNQNLKAEFAKAISGLNEEKIDLEGLTSILNKALTERIK